MPYFLSLLGIITSMSSPKLIVEYIGNNPSTLKVLAKVLGKEKQTGEVKSSIREEPESEK